MDSIAKKTRLDEIFDKEEQKIPLTESEQKELAQEIRKVSGLYFIKNILMMGLAIGGAFISPIIGIAAPFFAAFAAAYAYSYLTSGKGSELSKTFGTIASAVPAALATKFWITEPIRHAMMKENVSRAIENLTITFQ